MPDKYTKEEIEEMLLSLTFEQCTCNNPTIVCKMCEKVNTIREHLAYLLEQVDELKKNNECYACGSRDSSPRYCIECYSKLEKEIIKKRSR